MRAQHGDIIRAHITGMLEDGRVFASTAKGQPLEFALDGDNVIPGLRKALLGMAPGESKVQKVSAAEAYGPYRAERVIEVDRQRLPQHLNLHVGQRLRGEHPNGHKTRLRVKQISGSTVTLDANHMLAGKNLVFRIDLVEIVQPADKMKAEAGDKAQGQAG